VILDTNSRIVKKTVGRKNATISLAIAILFTARVAEAQTKIAPRIGWLSSRPTLMIPPPFIRGLRDLGWIEGRNIAIERRFVASELVQLKVGVIVAGDSLAIGRAKRATTTIPIVMMVHGDPVSAGHVASLARPGGNITGLSIRTADLAGKRLQILSEVVPSLRAWLFSGQYVIQSGGNWKP
jgi:putative tryptophan/tyrosine transport system substrate-binding protein